MEFEISDRVFLGISPMKGAIRLRKRGKISLRYIGPFEILRTIGEVAYDLTLLPSISSIHLFFHVSMLWGIILDKSHVLQ